MGGGGGGGGFKPHVDDRKIIRYQHLLCDVTPSGQC